VTTSHLEPASFRDPASTIFYLDDRVVRALAVSGAADWAALRETRFFERAVQSGRIVATTDVDLASLGDALPDGDWAAAVEHERIPFVSYPYEWTFSMLRDAAALHLELLLEALDEGLTMKDGYAFNVQWTGARPVFIDVPSFERSHGGPWAGYRQFCQTFLYPLLLQSHKGVDYHAWMRGSLEGIAPRDLRRLMSARDLLRPGTLKHVHLHAAMDARFTGKAQSVERELTSAGFTADLTKAIVNGLLKVVRKLRWHAGDSHWVDYRHTCNYSDADRAAKEAFVKEAVAQARPGLLWDLGCNDGAYARLAAEHAGQVVAIEGDHVVADSLYRSLRESGVRNVLPLVMDLANPSPGLGWAGTERRALTDRAKPDMVLYLALIHHLVIAGNVPMAAVLDWIRSLDAQVVIEFVDPDDSQAERLLANKPAGMHDDYRRDVFERLLEERFAVERANVLPSQRRALYVARPRS
jgi:hypothetical protein